MAIKKQKTFNHLLGLGYRAADLEGIANQEGGNRALTTLSNHSASLIKLRYSLADLVKIANRRSSSRNLIALSNHSALLIEQGYTLANLVEIANRRASHLNLIALSNHSALLIKLGYSQADLVKIANGIDSYLDLNALAVHHGELSMLGYSKLALLESLAMVEGYLMLEAWSKNKVPYRAENDKPSLLTKAAVPKLLELMNLKQTEGSIVDFGQYIRKLPPPGLPKLDLTPYDLGDSPSMFDKATEGPVTMSADEVTTHSLIGFPSTTAGTGRLPQVLPAADRVQSESDSYTPLIKRLNAIYPLSALN